MIALTEHPRGTILPVKARPGSRENAILGERAEALHIAVTAPPEKGMANALVARAISEALNLRGFRVILLTGETSRDKRFLIEDITPYDLRSRLDSLLGSNLPPNS